MKTVRCDWKLHITSKWNFELRHSTIDGTKICWIFIWNLSFVPRHVLFHILYITKQNKQKLQTYIALDTMKVAAINLETYWEPKLWFNSLFSPACGSIINIHADHVCHLQNIVCADEQRRFVTCSTSSSGFWTSPQSSPPGQAGAGWWGLLCRTPSAEAPPASWSADGSGAGTQLRMWSWLENYSQFQLHILMKHASSWQYQWFSTLQPKHFGWYLVV